MEFLLKATRESRGKKKLKHIIILTCRSLALVALVMAVARPLATSGFLSWGGSKLDTVILILDRSVSMEQGSPNDPTNKRETAIEMARDSISNLSDTKLVLIDSATGTPISISSPETLSSISQTSATDTSSSIPALLDTALQYILANDTGRTEVWLASDLQKSDWQPDNGKWRSIRSSLNNLQDQASLRILSLGSDTTQNSSIKLSQAQRINDDLLIELEINQSAEASATQVPLTLSLNNTQSSETVTINGETTKLTKRIPLSGKSGYGYIQLPADTNPRDNTAFFSYGAELPVNTAIVAPRSEAQRYFQLAAAPPGYANQQAKLYLPHQTIPWDTLSLVIWQSPLPQGDAQQDLLDFIAKGGIIAFFPPANTSDTEFLGTSWGLQSKASSGKFFIVSQWDRQDGPLRNGEDGTSIPVNKLKAIKRREINSIGSSIAQWSNKSSFISRELYGQGAAYFIATIPDYTWSNLGDADVILPLIQRLLQQGSQRFGSEFSSTIGQLPDELTIDLASRKRLDTATHSNSLSSEFEAGVYQFGDRKIAINIPPQETVNDFLNSEDIDQLLIDTPYALFEEEGDSKSGVAKQLWQLFLVAMLVFLIIEAILCLAQKRTKAEPLS